MTMIADFQRLMCSSEDAEQEQHQHEPPQSVMSRSEARLTSAYERAQLELVNEIIARIHAQPPDFFEFLVIDLLLSMGYGGRRRDLAQRLGRTGDGGVDGLVAQDELGLDLIYIQAKRLKPGTVVSVSDVRDFAGSLDARHAAKGAFFTTSHFSTSAIDFCGQVSRRVVLVDGCRLAELMMRHNIGVKVKESFQIKRLDQDYFTPASKKRMQEIISASIQARR